MSREEKRVEAPGGGDIDGGSGALNTWQQQYSTIKLITVSSICSCSCMSVMGAVKGSSFTEKPWWSRELEAPPSVSVLQSHPEVGMVPSVCQSTLNDLNNKWM